VIASKMFIVVDFTCLPKHQEDIATFLEENMGFEMETSRMELRGEELAASQKAEGEHKVFDSLGFEHKWDVISVLEALMGSDDFMIRKMKSLVNRQEREVEKRLLEAAAKLRGRPVEPTVEDEMEDS